MTYAELIQQKIQEIFDNDEHGIFEEQVKYKTNQHSEYQAAIDTLEAINEFYQESQREPDRKAKRGTTERVLANNLVGFRRDKDELAHLKEFDRHHLIFESPVFIPKSAEDIFANDDLGLFDDELSEPVPDIFTATHVTYKKPSEYDDTYGEGTKPCQDFQKFENAFVQVHEDLKQKKRTLINYKSINDIKPGVYFVLRGMLLYIEAMDEKARKIDGRTDRRLRIIYENGTESDMFRLSLKKRINEHNGKVVTEPDVSAQDFVNQNMGSEDIATGYIYVLKSLSTHPEISAMPNLYKIGLARESVEKRIKYSNKEATYLKDDVQVVAEYKCFNLNLSKLENLIHHFFSEVCLDVSVIGKYGQEIKPKEWFVVPIEQINEAIKLLVAGSIVNYRYDKDLGRIVLK